MQKKLNFVKISKIRLVFSSVIALFICVCVATSINYTQTRNEKPVKKDAESIYKQLKALSLPEKSVNADSVKMNNLVLENSKIDAITSVTDVKNILVYDAATGNVFEKDLEYVTLCSLIAEMPQSFEAEALKAQAVACRTFAVRSAKYPTKHKNAHICTDYRCCQSYIDADSCNFDIQKAKEAVNATQGIIAVYDGVPIIAAYHASSFGMTKSSKEVWGGEVLYLEPVISAEAKEVSAYTISISKDRLFSLLGADSGNISFLYNEDGICTGIYAGNKNFSPWEIKKLLGLRSEKFSIKDAANTYEITSYGFGHGVGMSQHGANALAACGYDFYSILKHYYSGISFAFAV